MIFLITLILSVLANSIVYFLFKSQAIEVSPFLALSSFAIILTSNSLVAFLCIKRLPSKPHEFDPNKLMGTVKWFNTNKGFGFITDEEGNDIFVHYKAIVGDGRKKLYEGQSVSFVAKESDRGLQASEVEAL